MDIEKVAAVLWNHAVGERNFGAKTNEPTGQMGSDEADSPGYENVGAGETVVIRRHRVIVGRDQKDFL